MLRTPVMAHAASRPDTLAAVRVEETGASLGVGELREPTGIAADSRGFVYVADAMTGKVYRYSPNGGSVEFERPPDNPSFYPIDIAVQESFVYVLDYSTNALLRYDYRGAYLDVLVSFDQFPDLRPVSVSTGPGGRILVTDIAHHSVSGLTALLDLELTLGQFGSGPGTFNEPRKAVFLPDERIAVVESGNRRVQVFSPAGAFERVLPLPPAAFALPRSICADAQGNIFVADAQRGVIVYEGGDTSTFVIDSFAGNPIAPSALAIDWSNKLYVADLTSRSIHAYHLVYPGRR
jgi:streptogramin lyase